MKLSRDETNGRTVNNENQEAVAEEYPWMQSGAPCLRSRDIIS